MPLRIRQLEIVNPTFHDAEPLITIYGTGDITLTVNGKDFPFKKCGQLYKSGFSS